MIQVHHTPDTAQMGLKIAQSNSKSTRQGCWVELEFNTRH